MGSIDDPLHSLLIRPERKKGGKCTRQKGKGRGDRKESRSWERAEGLLGNTGD